MIVSGTNLQETDIFLQFVDQSFYLSVKLSTDRVLGRNSERASECGPPCFSRSCLLAFHESVDLRRLTKSTIYPAELSFIWPDNIVSTKQPLATSPNVFLKAGETHRKNCLWILQLLVLKMKPFVMIVLFSCPMKSIRSAWVTSTVPGWHHDRSSLIQLIFWV